jgi:hypothetical protein
MAAIRQVTEITFDAQQVKELLIKAATDQIAKSGVQVGDGEPSLSHDGLNGFVLRFPPVSPTVRGE